MTESNENHESITDLYAKIVMLDTRILKLETIIVNLSNVEEDPMDLAELAQMVRDNEEGWRDR